MPKKAFVTLAIAILCLVIGVGVYFNYTKSNTAKETWYGLKVKGHQRAAYSSALRRSTTDIQNKWNLWFNASSEGYHSKMIFFLDRHGETVSKEHTIPVRTEKYAFSAFRKANNSDVRLGVKNNNDTITQYEVSGYWMAQS